MLLFGAALVLMMLFRPAGLWPSSIRRRELAAPREPAGAEGADVPR
jgi:branched-chain amino acid transport system permease protein